jgi:hypothetical protein
MHRRHLLPHPTQCLSESDGDGALPFTGRRRVRRRDDDERPAHRTLCDFERNLRLVLPVKIELVALEAELGGDVLDRTHLHALRDFDIGGDHGSAHVLLLELRR